MGSLQSSEKKIGILGVPLGYGAGKAGSELGVEAIRLSRVRGAQLSGHLAGLGYEVKDHGNAPIVQPTKPADPAENPKYAAEMAESFRNVSASLKKV